MKMLLASRKLGEPVAQQRICEPYYPGPRSDILRMQSFFTPGSRLSLRSAGMTGFSE